MKTKPTVGQTLYRLLMNNRARRGIKPELTPVLVTSVGRKYFTAKSKDGYQFETKFHLSNGFEASDYSPGYRVYESEQEYLDDVELERLANNLREAFSGYGKTKFTLEQLRAVAAILFP